MIHFSFDLPRQLRIQQLGFFLLDIFWGNVCVIGQQRVRESVGTDRWNGGEDG